MTRMAECPECGGQGFVQDPDPLVGKLTCSDCDGTGEIEVEHEADEDAE